MPRPAYPKHVPSLPGGMDPSEVFALNTNANDA